MKMTSRFINNVLNFFSNSASNDDDHHFRTDNSHHYQRHRTYPKKETRPFVPVTNGKTTDPVDSFSNHGVVATAIADVRAHEETSSFGEVSPRAFRRRVTHEAAGNKRETVNLRRYTYHRDTEASARKKRKETVILKETQRETPKETPPAPKEILKETLWEITSSAPKETPPALKEVPRELSKEAQPPTPKEAPKEALPYPPKETVPPRDLVREARIELENLRSQLVVCQKELFEANQKNFAAERRIQTVEKERDSVASRLRSTLVERNALTNTMDGRLSALDGRNRKQEAELRLVQDALRVSDEKNVQLSKLLEEKTADFKGTQTFLTTADLYSGAEIIGMVETLNAEIFQISAFTAELLEDDTAIATEEERNSNVYQHADLLEMAAHRIGHEFLEQLNTKHVHLRADPLPLQLAVQGLLSAHCVHEVQTFRSDQLGGSLDQLYQRIKAAEVQAVAGRWRAITSATLRDDRDDSSTQMTLELIVGLLCLCGYSTSNQQSIQSIGTLQKMLRDLEKLQNKLKTAIKEGITTADFEIAAFGPGEGFNPSSMENVYAENDQKAPQGLEGSVLTAVGVGLHKRVTRFTPVGEPKDQLDVLCRTKVVLLSVLHLFDEADQ